MTALSSTVGSGKLGGLTNGKWSTGLYGRNLTDKAVLQQANPAGPVNVVGVIGDPRTYGARVTARF